MKRSCNLRGYSNISRGVNPWCNSLSLYASATAMSFSSDGPLGSYADFTFLMYWFIFIVRPSHPNVLCFYENTTTGCIEQMFTS